MTEDRIRLPANDGESKPVCLITGVGDSTGAALARRFAAGGYRVAMIARNAQRLEALEQEIEGSKAFICDVGELEALLATVDRVRQEMGKPAVLVHNAVASTFDSFLDAARDYSRKHGQAEHWDRICVMGEQILPDERLLR